MNGGSNYSNGNQSQGTSTAPSTPLKDSVTAPSSQYKTPSKPPKIVKKRLRKIELKPKAYDKYLWIAGHVLCIVGTVIYSLYYLTYKSHQSWIATISYVVGLLGSVVLYFVSMVNLFGKVAPSYFALLTTENFQYLLLALVWIFNRSSLFKILPFALISLLQLSTMFKIKPIVLNAKLIEKVIVYNELLLFVLLFVDTLLLRGTSGYALVIFTLFYSLKLLFNDDTKALVYSVIIKLDGVLLKQKNPKIQSMWTDIKSFLLKKQEAKSSYSFQIKK